MGKEKKDITYKGIKLRMAADLTSDTVHDRMQFNGIFQVLKICQPTAHIQ